MNTKIPTKLLSLVAAASLAASASFAQDNAVTSDVVGYVTTTCLGGSDTFISVPLHDSLAATGTVSSVNAGSSQITLSINAMTSDQYKDSHFVRFGEGSTLEGAKFTISGNTSDTLTLDPVTGYDLSDVATDDVVHIIPHTTLAALFSSVSSLPDNTEVFYFNNAVNQINKSSSGGYLYYESVWYDSQSGANANGAVLFPDDTLVVRVPGDSNNDFNLSVSGTVPNVGHSFVISTAAAGANDNYVAPQIPAAVPLGELFPNAADNDEILIFDNSQRAINKSSSGGYLSYESVWYDSQSGAVADSFSINPWQLAVYRRADQSSSSAIIVSGRADYLD